MNIKSQFILNGAPITIETESANDLAAVLRSITSKAAGPTTSTVTRVKPIRKVVQRAAMPVRVNKQKGTKRGTYFKWTDADIMRVATIAQAYGPVRRGLGRMVHRALQEQGDVKGRSQLNNMIFADRMHRFIQTGHTKGINQNVLAVLEKNGVKPVNA